LIETIQQHADLRIKFAQGEKLAVAQHREDPAFDHLHADFDLGFISGLTRASRQHGDSVMLGQIAVAGVNVRLVAMRLGYATAQVVRLLFPSPLCGTGSAAQE